VSRKIVLKSRFASAPALKAALTRVNLSYYERARRSELECPDLGVPLYGDGLGHLDAVDDLVAQQHLLVLRRKLNGNLIFRWSYQRSKYSVVVPIRSMDDEMIIELGRLLGMLGHAYDEICARPEVPVSPGEAKADDQILSVTN
jgi:hypothetical protein